MKKMVFVLAVVLCLFVAASTAHAQFWPSYSYSYNFYPGGGSYNYNVSNGYESVSVTQRVGYGSAYYSYDGPYGSYSWLRNTSYPVYYPTYSHYHSYPIYRWHYYRR